MLIYKTEIEQDLIKDRIIEIKDSLYIDINGRNVDPLIERIAELELFVEGLLSRSNKKYI